VGFVVGAIRPRPRRDRDLERRWAEVEAALG
jgi:hypothetical protein